MLRKYSTLLRRNMVIRVKPAVPDLKQGPVVARRGCPAQVNDSRHYAIANPSDFNTTCINKDRNRNRAWNANPPRVFDQVGITAKLQSIWAQ